MTQQFECFLTGSHAYGSPYPASDVDIAICVSDKAVIAMLRENASGDGESGGKNIHSLRFGSLNLICLEPDEYKAWKAANDELIAMRPVTRGQAIISIDRQFIAAGVTKRGGW